MNQTMNAFRLALNSTALSMLGGATNVRITTRTDGSWGRNKGQFLALKPVRKVHAKSTVSVVGDDGSIVVSDDALTGLELGAPFVEGAYNLVDRNYGYLMLVAATDANDASVTVSRTELVEAAAEMTQEPAGEAAPAAVEPVVEEPTELVVTAPEAPAVVAEEPAAPEVATFASREAACESLGISPDALRGRIRRGTVVISAPAAAE